MTWFRRVNLLLSFSVAAATLTSAAGSLPGEVTTQRATRLELLRDGQPAGSVGLPAGAVLSLVEVEGRNLVVRYRNLAGRVAAGDTNLPMAAMVSPSTSSAPTETSPSPAVKPEPPLVSTAREPASAMERRLAGSLVVLENGRLQPASAARLTGIKFYAIYFSAGWCPPCREFTPGLVDAYAKLREVYPELEVVLINRDRSPAEMFNYMRDDRMAWPAVRWDRIRGATELNRYAGSGIPCLVLVDAEGKVLSDSYRWGRYVGPDAVLDDTWKILRDYRRGHPRTKA